MSHKYFIAIPDNEPESTKNGDYQLVILKIREDFAQVVFDTIKTVEPKPRLSYYDFNLDDDYITCHWVDSKHFYKHNPGVEIGIISEKQYIDLSYNILTTDVIRFDFDEANGYRCINIVCTPSSDNTEEITAPIDLPSINSQPVTHHIVPMVTPPDIRKTRWIFGLIILNICGWTGFLWRLFGE